uniref:V-SNARE domain-containing protein n=1 Tax=Macrostomum lignano TaxID=282301 RepID=A0A1I8FUV8_9PLAT
DRVTTISQAERLFAEAKETLEQLELEIRSQPPSLRQKYTTRPAAELFREHRRNWREAGQAKRDRDELLSEAEQSLQHRHDELASDYRTPLLDNTNVSNVPVVVSTKALAVWPDHSGRSGRTAGDAGARRDRLRGADRDLGASSRILSGMLRRVVQNRALLLLILAVVLIVIGLAVYTPWPGPTCLGGRPRPDEWRKSGSRGL